MPQELIEFIRVNGFERRKEEGETFILIKIQQTKNKNSDDNLGNIHVKLLSKLNKIYQKKVGYGRELSDETGAWLPDHVYKSHVSLFYFGFQVI